MAEQSEITAADRQAAVAFWAAEGPFRMGLNATLSKAFAQHRIATLEQVARELPDEIDLFRAIRDAGRKNSQKAGAAYALIPAKLHALATNHQDKG